MSLHHRSVVIVIPAYKPEPLLVTLVNTLVARGYVLIVVDDGSGEHYQAIFEQLRATEKTTVLTHDVNLGKGQALKTAFSHFLSAYSDKYVGVVTADADGQHCVEDIVSLAEYLAAQPQVVCLGVRQFDRHVPWKSLLGNRLTRRLFRWLTKVDMQDTQTGLRAIPNNCLAASLKIRTSAYDFELEMLIELVKQSWELRQLPINTIYIAGNANSHFNPIIDSLKIYCVLLRFFAHSITTPAMSVTRSLERK